MTLPGDDVRRPPPADSTIAEWLADPRGAQVLGELFAAMAANGGGAMAQTAADPEMFTLMGSMPIGRLVAFAGDAFAPEALSALIKSATSPVADPSPLG